jgi:hypothetical protein
MVCAYFAQFSRTDRIPTAHLKYRPFVHKTEVHEIFNIRRRGRHWKFLKITKFLKIGSTVNVLGALTNHTLIFTALLNSGTTIVMKYQSDLHYNSAFPSWLL